MRPKIVFLSYMTLETVLQGNEAVGPVLGGPAAYGALTVARLGGEPCVVTAIGQDMPNELWEAFETAPISLQGVKRVLRCTQSILTYRPDGTKVIDFPVLGPEIRDTDIPSEYLDADCVWICPMRWEVAISAIEAFRRAGVACGVDLGGFGGAHSGPAVTRFYDGREELRRVLELADIVKLSDEDGKQLLGPGLTEEAMLRTLIASGPSLVILTRGSRGALAMARPDRLISVPPYPSSGINPTGAGDIFSASFLWSRFGGSSLEAALTFAAAAAALAVSREGGAHWARLPSREEVNRALQTEARNQQQ